MIVVTEHFETIIKLKGRKNEKEKSLKLSYIFREKNTNEEKESIKE
jgi:hypothetical protein